MKTLLSRFQTGTGQELFASPPVPAPESIFPLRKALGLDVQTWLFCSHLLLNSCVTDSVLPKRERTVHTQPPSESKQLFPCGTLPCSLVRTPSETGIPAVCLIKSLYLILNDFTSEKETFRHQTITERHLPILINQLSTSS